jgi:hypothetical protein
MARDSDSARHRPGRREAIALAGLLAGMASAALLTRVVDIHASAISAVI